MVFHKVEIVYDTRNTCTCLLFHALVVDFSDVYDEEEQEQEGGDADEYNTDENWLLLKVFQSPFNCLKA